MRRRFGALWRHPDFLKLWAGETISLFGSQVTTLALPLVAVLLLKATPAQMGILTAAGFAPFLLLTMFVGVWVDRIRRRPVLIGANIGRALLLGLVPMLALTGRLRIEHLFVIAFLMGVLTVCFYIAYQSFLPSLVRREDLIEANSKLQASESIAEIGGPSAAGLLVQLISAPLTLLVDAVSFLLSAVGLLLIRAPEPPPAPPVACGLVRQIGESFRDTFGNPYLRAFAGEAAAYNFFWQVIETIFVLYAIRELQIGPGLIGLILAIGSAGALCGALLTDRLALRFGIGATILGGTVIGDLAPLLIPFVGGATPGALALLGLAFFSKGFGTTACNVHVNTLRQALIPDRQRGRMNASYRLIVSGAFALGALLSGALGERIGLRATLMVGAVGLLFTWLWVWFSPVPRLWGLSALADEPLA